MVMLTSYLTRVVLSMKRISEGSRVAVEVVVLEKRRHDQHTSTTSEKM